MTKKSFIKNIKKAFLTRSKLGDILTADAFKYFTKCSPKAMFEKGFITKEKHNVFNGKGELEAENVPCYRFTDKFDKLLLNNGYKKNYNSCSDNHDIMLSNNLCKVAKSYGANIENYMCEKELSSSKYGHSRPDGAFIIGGTTILIEQTTQEYTQKMIDDKKAYADEFGLELQIF